MFIFQKEQIIHTIGGVRIGGNPGELPTVLAGSIFYSGHKVVSDPLRGIFDRSEAEELINIQDEMSSTTGNPCMVQIVSESDEALRKFIDFAAEHSDAPLIIDSTSADVRCAGLRYAEETGLLDRVIYNSLNISATEEEIEFLKEFQHESAIILAFNPQDPSIAGRRAILEQGALNLDTGLLTLCDELGITKPLIDTATTAMGAGAGSSLAFTFVSKSKYGLPTGSGIHNAPSSWPWLNEYKKKNKEAFKACDFSSNLAVQLLGGDFVLYGPIKNASSVFPIIAMADVFSAEYANLEFGIDAPDDHPLKRLF
ncbi:MAG: tetrahydromethanopterin S-methyltransferase subunit H [Candidatus Thorarchaeota archaeon]